MNCIFVCSSACLYLSGNTCGINHQNFTVLMLPNLWHHCLNDNSAYDCDTIISPTTGWCLCVQVSVVSGVFVLFSVVCHTVVYSTVFGCLICAYSLIYYRFLCFLVLNIASMKTSERDKCGAKRNRKVVDLEKKIVRQHESSNIVSVITCDLSSQYICVRYFSLTTV